MRIPWLLCLSVMGCDTPTPSNGVAGERDAPAPVESAGSDSALSVPKAPPFAPQEPLAAEPSPKIIDFDGRADVFCVLLEDATLQCADPATADAGWKRLGFLPSELPAEPAALLGSGPQRPYAITLSEFNICALRDDHSVMCWASGHESFPLAKLEGAVPVQIDAGRAHACARMRSGRVACWGKNDEGQLGDGTRKDRQDAVWVDGLDHAVDHAVGSHHVCALENDEQVVCWGSNDHGQLGTRGGPRTRPVRVPNVSGASDIVSGLGARQTCAILPGRDVLCWGSWGNRRTEVGAQRLNLEPLPDSSTAVEIAVTPHQICGRRSGDTTVCWDRAEDSGKAGPVYGPPTPAFEGHEVHRLTGGSFRMLGQTDDTTLVLRSRTLGSLNPDAVFSVSGPVPP